MEIFVYRDAVVLRYLLNPLANFQSESAAGTKYIVVLEVWHLVTK
jgi:hypothetical protein